MIESTANGLYCRAADFYIDPSGPVGRAVITHAHADHARLGCGSYLATPQCAILLKARLGSDVRVQELPYGISLDMNGVRLSLHPAGHILGSAQVRLEHCGEVWVVTGDFKHHSGPDLRALRAAALPYPGYGVHLRPSGFQLARPTGRCCRHHFWWRKNSEQGKPSILFAYSLGKAQRIAAQVDAGIGPIFTHGAVEHMMKAYRQAGVPLNPTLPVSETLQRQGFNDALVISPPSAEGSPWMRRFPGARRAFASGWMQIRGNRRRRALDRGFVLSDHADWKGLLQTIEASGAERIRVTHGYAAEMVRFLREKGLSAEALPNAFSGETEAPDA